MVDFITRLYAVYVECQFTYLEINPLVVIPNEARTEASVHFLDMAAKLDSTADHECGVKWAIARSPAALGITAVASATGEKVNIDAGPPMEFPAPFGRELTKEEAYIADLDAKTGASLKLTVLNATGRIWTLVAGGGASVVYADAIASCGFADERKFGSFPLGICRCILVELTICLQWPTTASTLVLPPSLRLTTTPGRSWT